jgi:hypothetical protein
MISIAVATAAVITLFAVFLFFFPAKKAIFLAVIAVFFGWCGSAIAALVLAPFVPRTLESTSAVLIYLGTPAASGCVLASFSVWLVFSRRKK